MVALWFGLLGWFFDAAGGTAGAVWYVGAALLAAASAFAAIAAGVSAERTWLRRAGWATGLMVLWMVGAGLVVAALD